MVANTFNSRFCKTRQGVLCEIEASLICIVISRPARAMQRPCLQIPNQINPQNQTKQNKVHLPLCPPHLDVNFIAVLFHISLYKSLLCWKTENCCCPWLPTRHWRQDLTTYTLDIDWENWVGTDLETSSLRTSSHTIKRCYISCRGRKQPIALSTCKPHKSQQWQPEKYPWCCNSSTFVLWIPEII